MSRSMIVVFLLAPASVPAARYDPDPDRAALRQAASVGYSGIVDTTGLALVPEKVPAITAGLDEGLRQAHLAAGSARSLDAATQARAADMTAGVKPALDVKLKERTEAIAAERFRWQRLSAEHETLKNRVDALPDAEKGKLQPLLAKAENPLRAAADALRPLEQSVKIVAERVLAMKDARNSALGPLAEIITNAAEVVRLAESLPAAINEAKTRLAALGQEPRDVSRSRAWQKLEPLRDITRLLLAAADRACNRADDFRRSSTAFSKAWDDCESQLSASSGVAVPKARLDEAEQVLAAVRERLRKS